MGTAEINTTRKNLYIRSVIFLYGQAASGKLAGEMQEEIETMWNEPAALVTIAGHTLQVAFQISVIHREILNPEEIFSNTNPCNNYFRVEEFSMHHISFVDGLGSNTGYFKLDNLYKGSTTAAHEYGHTLGLKHPKDLDLRGKGVPGIMYPRGTLVDAPYQYNPAARSGDNTNGGTMNPVHRRVLQEDIAALRLAKASYNEEGIAIIGEFTSLWHPDHAGLE